MSITYFPDTPFAIARVINCNYIRGTRNNGARDTLNSQVPGGHHASMKPPKIRVLLVNMQFIIKLSISVARAVRSIIYSYTARRAKRAKREMQRDISSAEYIRVQCNIPV